ncbi:MAG: CpaF family protein [Chloroflexi bacterium]|nr:CpaF family protein [Chloroflexota bacterium]MBI3340770.1 CpaF family protein [Chloroflexota bacterium]
MSWVSVAAPLDEADRKRVVADVASQLQDLSLAEMRGDREKLIARVAPLVQSSLSRLGLQTPPEQALEISREVVARVGGLGFLEPFLRLDANLSEIVVTPDGGVWVQRKSAPAFEKLSIAPSLTDVWRATETLLAPLGRAVTEASPSVDAKIPRQEGLPGGARIKIIHPVVAPGLGYPSINIRLFEPKPVPPERLVEWKVAPSKVIDSLVGLVSNALRILVIGGTASGKTTLLSALCHGIPKDARVVKIEDPEEIWLDHPHVVTLEARPAQVGSSILPYSLASAVDDAMRMSPKWLIVGEMRRGDAVAALFRAQMSDHPGLSTFHAEGPEAAVMRLNLLLAGDVGIRAEAAKEMFAQAVDLIVQVGWHSGRRAMVGVWEVEKTLKGGNVQFRQVYKPGDEDLLPISIERRV